MGISSLSLSCNLRNPANTHIWPQKHSMQGKESTRLNFFLCECLHGTSLSAQWLKKKKICLPMEETQVGSLGGEDPLGREMATHSSIHAWEIPWTEESGGLQSMGLQTTRLNNKEYLPTPSAVSSLTIPSLEIKLDGCCYLPFKQERLIVCVLDLLYFGAHFSISRIE